MVGGKIKFSYFSHSGPQEQGFWMYSARSESLDEVFTSEGPQVNATDVSDPAVVFFDGRWHYFASKGETVDGKIVNVHAVSDTGLDFTRVNDSILLDIPFWGNAIDDGGKLRFFSGWKSASSLDGDVWTMEEGVRVEVGADPGIVKLPDGTYMVIYVGGPPDSPT